MDGNGWRKSSYSFSNGDCLEARWQASSHCVARECLEARWQKSGHSKSGNCVEARQDGTVQVRDSQDPAGPVLAFGGSAWARFLATLKG